MSLRLRNFLRVRSVRRCVRADFRYMPNSHSGMKESELVSYVVGRAAACVMLTVKYMSTPAVVYLPLGSNVQIDEPETWSELGHAQLNKKLVADAIGSYLRANDTTRHE